MAQPWPQETEAAGGRRDRHASADEKAGRAITRLNEQINDTGQERRSAIVEPKKLRNTMLAHLIDDFDPEEHRRTGEKADELFREIVRRVAASKGK